MASVLSYNYHRDTPEGRAKKSLGEFLRDQVGGQCNDSIIEHYWDYLRTIKRAEFNDRELLRNIPAETTQALFLEVCKRYEAGDKASRGDFYGKLAAHRYTKDFYNDFRSGKGFRYIPYVELALPDAIVVEDVVPTTSSSSQVGGGPHVNALRRSSRRLSQTLANMNAAIIQDKEADDGSKRGRVEDRDTQKHL